MISVTVGIPTLNGPDRFARALESIRVYTDWPRIRKHHIVKLLAYDDGSRSDVLENNRYAINAHTELQDAASLELISSETRHGIAHGWNLLVRRQHCDVAVLLNDDIEVSSHWLDVLLYSVLENPRAGMVALNAYVALTRAQHRATHSDLPDHVLHPRVDYHEAHLMSAGGELLASSGSAFAFRRAAYDEVGGFDPRYRCFYEELDFGVSLRMRGYEHFISSYPILYHMGGATTSVPENMDGRADLENSRRAFREKWGNTPNGMRAALSTVPKRDNLPVREWSTSFANIDE